MRCDRLPGLRTTDPTPQGLGPARAAQPSMLSTHSAGGVEHAQARRTTTVVSTREYNCHAALHVDDGRQDATVRPTAVRPTAGTSCDGQPCILVQTASLGQ